MKHIKSSASLALASVALLAGVGIQSAHAEPQGFLETLHKHTTLINTVPSNGDQNPYALVVAPVTTGTVKQGDVLVGNFNNAANLQGTGSTIVNYHPDTKQMTVFATVPRDLKECPGGIGLSTAMTMLKSGWVIDDSDTNRSLTTALARSGFYMSSLTGFQFFMATAAAFVINRWKTSGGLVAPIPATPYPDERYQTKMIWWDSRDFINYAEPGQVAKILTENELLTREIHRRGDLASAWQEVV